MNPMKISVAPIDNFGNLTRFALVTGVCAAMTAVVTTYSIMNKQSMPVTNFETYNTITNGLLGTGKAFAYAGGVVLVAYATTYIAATAVKIPTNIVGGTIGYGNRLATGSLPSLYSEVFSSRPLRTASDFTGRVTRVVVTAPMLVAAAAAVASKKIFLRSRKPFTQSLEKVIDWKPFSYIPNASQKLGSAVAATIIGVPACVLVTAVKAPFLLKPVAKETPASLTRRTMNSYYMRGVFAATAIATFGFVNYQSYRNTVESLPVKPARLVENLPAAVAVQNAQSR